MEFWPSAWRKRGTLWTAVLMARTAWTIGLILIPSAGDGGECRQTGGRDGPQAGLGIPEQDPAQPVQEKGHGVVSPLAFGRYLGAGKVSAP